MSETRLDLSRYCTATCKSFGVLQHYEDLQTGEMYDRILKRRWKTWRGATTAAARLNWCTQPARGEVTARSSATVVENVSREALGQYLRYHKPKPGCRSVFGEKGSAYLDFLAGPRGVVLLGKRETGAA